METELTTSTESTVGGIRNANVSAVPPKPTVIFYFQSDVNLNPVAAVVGASFALSGTTSCDQLKDILGPLAGPRKGHRWGAVTCGFVAV
jgi:hypothetical protein